jgi:hypothetical protein
MKKKYIPAFLDKAISYKVDLHEELDVNVTCKLKRKSRNFYISISHLNLISGNQHEIHNFHAHVSNATICV